MSSKPNGCINSPSCPAATRKFACDSRHVGKNISVINKHSLQIEEGGGSLSTRGGDYLDGRIEVPGDVCINAHFTCITRRCSAITCCAPRRTKCCHVALHSAMLQRYTTHSVVLTNLPSHMYAKLYLRTTLISCMLAYRRFQALLKIAHMRPKIKPVQRAYQVTLRT